MKAPVALLALVLATGVLHAQVPAPKPPIGKAVPEKKGDEMGKIEGMTIARANGTFLGLTLEDGKYKLSFYDKKKKPTPVDVTRATARWPNRQGPGDFRTVLNPAGPTHLLGAQFVRGLHAFKLYITLLRGEGDATEAVETFVVDFRG